MTCVPYLCDDEFMSNANNSNGCEADEEPNSGSNCDYI